MSDEQIVTDDAFRKDYDQWHEQMGRVEAETPLAYPWYESVHRGLETTSTGRLLEVGCGRGQFAIWLAKRKPSLEIVGLDFSEMAINLARERAAAEQVDVEFVRGDAQALQYADETFDIVMSCECMEHVSSPPNMARELARVLKPGGRFLLTTENYLNGILLGWLMSWVRREPFNSGLGRTAEGKFLRILDGQRLSAKGRLDRRSDGSLTLPVAPPSTRCPLEVVYAAIR